MRAALAVTLSSVSAAALAAQNVVQQVHLALTGRPDEMLVQYATASAAPFPTVVYYGEDCTQLDLSATGDSFVFDDNGTMTAPLRLHNVVLTGLRPRTTYCYTFGAGAGTSHLGEAFNFTSGPTRPDGSKTYAIFADLGLDQDIALPALYAAAAAGQYDAIVSSGDYAYDMSSEKGQTGNEFMQAMQPITARIPMNVAAGNHEAGPNNDFSQYTARFHGIGATAGAYSGSGTSLWYSFNDGLVHWVALDTELWPQGGTDEQIAAFLEWLAADLAAVDRTATPWVFVFGHRQQWMKGAGGWGKMDPLLHQYHVQLGFFGHEHNYQRLLPMNDGSVHAGCVSADQATYMNCNHTTSIVVGSPGCAQGIGDKTAPDGYLAVSSFNYGFGLLTVHNSTHAQWRWQMVADGERNTAVAGQVADEFWIVDYYADAGEARQPSDGASDR